MLTRQLVVGSTTIKHLKKFFQKFFKKVLTNHEKYVIINRKKK